MTIIRAKVDARRLVNLVKQEETRQQETLTLIPSENYTSRAVRTAVGSVLMNKYSEGAVGRRYYCGNEIVDQIETLAIEKAKKVFKVPHANVQPYSGSCANLAVFFALLNPGDKIMGLRLNFGGHLTHGHPQITASGRFYQSVQFETNKKGRIDYLAVENLAKKERPKLIIVGSTSYPFIINWKKFALIAESVGAWLVADISHVAGLVVAGVYPSPVSDVDVVVTTTHKTLRGPRGAIIMTTQKGVSRDKDIGNKIDRAVFPGLQGGPQDHSMAGIAQALIEADSKEFRRYSRRVVENASVLARELVDGGLTLVGGGTESHLMVVDLRPLQLPGSLVAEALCRVGLVVNKNGVPNDTAPPSFPSGIRLGTPGVTTRGMGKLEMETIAKLILSVIVRVSGWKLSEGQKRCGLTKIIKRKIEKDSVLGKVAVEVDRLCVRFPLFTG